MSSTTPAAPPDPPPGATPEEIEADIEAARERLASSVDALTAKLDVKAQAKQKARETSAQARQKAQETSAQAKQKAQETSERVVAGAQQAYERARTTSPTVLGAIAAGVVGLVVLLVRRAAAALLSPKLSARGHLGAFLTLVAAAMMGRSAHVPGPSDDCEAPHFPDDSQCAGDRAVAIGT